MRLPVVVTDDNDGVSVLRIVSFVEREEAPSLGSHTEHIEHAAGDHLTPRALDIGYFSDRKQIAAIRRHGAHEPQVVAIVAEVQVRRGDRLAIRGSIFDRYDAVWINGSREGIQYERPQPTEDRGVRANANGDREDRHGGKRGTVSETPQGIAQVLPHGGHFSFLSYS